MVDLYRAAYAARLFARIDQGVIVPLEAMSVTLENGQVWVPEANHCHRNCAKIAKFYPEKFSAVRGWLVFDFRVPLGQVQFMPHSVVRGLDTGRLFDPTPQARNHPHYAFIPESAVDGDYDQVAGQLAHGELLAHPAQ